jgi:hypothetical protein
MQSDLQRTALRRLAQLTANDQLSSESRPTLQNRLLKGCSELSKRNNGIKRVNGKSTENVTLVYSEYTDLLTISSYGMNTIQC